MLTGSNQKVSDQERGSNVPLRRRCITGVRAEPKLLKVVFMWNVETPYHSGTVLFEPESESQDEPIGQGKKLHGTTPGLYQKQHFGAG